MNEELIERIHNWGKERGLHDTQDLRPQLIKLGEEFGELCAGVARDDDRRIMDALGDMLVVMVQFSAVYGRRYGGYGPDGLELAVNYAWRHIQNRSGRTKEGIFVRYQEGAGHD